jgi:uncharacterized protein (DUF1800 family)
MSINAVIATNRFGLGAKPGEHEHASVHPQNWLIKQLAATNELTFSDEEKHSNTIILKLSELRQRKQMLKKTSKLTPKTNDMASSNEMLKQIAKYPKNIYRELSIESLKRGINSNNSLQWRLLDFFSNHFSVSAQGPMLKALAPTLEREAIAPNLLGRFEDMLLAVSKHPAMLLYLNNERSFGPNSKLGKRGKGLNENLAREILELHTLSVNGGYTQRDVTEFAKAITGWSVANPLKEKERGFKFRSKGHEPGTRYLLSKSFPASEQLQGENILKYLANHPSTVRYICYKLARHFVQDNPPESLIIKMTQRWNLTRGNIRDVVVELIRADEPWQPAFNKFKSPREFVVSTLRAIDAKQLKGSYILNALTELGQKPFSAGSPAGFSDVEEGWNSSSALMARIDLSSQFSAKRRLNSEKLMKTMLGTSLSPRTYNMVLRAESRQQAATLLLMSPEFQRR